MKFVFRWVVLVAALSCAASEAFELSDRTRQCVVGVAEGWDSSHATLRRYEKRQGKWQQVGPEWRARLGRSGLAWGRGLHPVPDGATLKKEGDWRAPAGVFAIGGAWGYQRDIQRHPKLPYRQVTTRDLWVEDPKSPHYNRNVVLNYEPKSAWEKKQQMKQDDAAHALKLFIAHNAPPKVVSGGGSSIFFHIWRNGGKSTTAGCTTQAEEPLRTLIAWLDPAQRPVYVLLPKAEYAARREAWKLP